MKSLKRHGTAASRIRKALEEVASETGAHADNITQLVGSSGYRLRVGDYRVVFEVTNEVIVVTRIGPRSSIYR